MGPGGSLEGDKDPPSPSPVFRSEGERRAEPLLPPPPPRQGGTKHLHPRAVKGHPPIPTPYAQRRKGRQRARNAPGKMRAESCQIILPFPWKPGLAEVSVCANEALAGVWGEGWGAGRTREPDAETLRLAEAEDKRGWRAGSFSRNPSYSWPASQLLERCVCGLKNGAIVSTRPLLACRVPSACSSTALQRGPILSLPPLAPQLAWG